MPKLSESELLGRDAQRDLNAELLEAVDQMKAGHIGLVSVMMRDERIIESPIAKARVASCLSQV
jgi:hypothetical protein